MNNIDELEHEIRLVRARNQRLEKLAADTESLIEKFESWDTESSAIHRSTKYVELKKIVRKIKGDLP